MSPPPFGEREQKRRSRSAWPVVIAITAAVVGAGVMFAVMSARTPAPAPLESAAPTANAMEEYRRMVALFADDLARVMTLEEFKVRRTKLDDERQRLIIEGGLTEREVNWINLVDAKLGLTELHVSIQSQIGTNRQAFKDLADDFRQFVNQPLSVQR